jgi:zinc transporter ZupT
MPDVVWVVLVALVAGSATGLGAIPVLLMPQIDQRLFDMLIGFARS